MTISQNDMRVLFQRSANRCAFPKCGKLLIQTDSPIDNPTAISQMAHIVGEKQDGPRGSYPLPPEERDKYDNLILLCPEHHHLIDANPDRFSVELIRFWKEDHEKAMERATGQAVEQQRSNGSQSTLVSETVYSTLLPVSEMPKFIYGAPSPYIDANEAGKQIVFAQQSHNMYPFILREGRIYCFSNLSSADNPFRNIVDSSKAQRYDTHDWLADPDFRRWFIELLNRSLNKLTGRRGLNWDKEHKRYFFQPKAIGETLKVLYQPLNQSRSERQVVWSPITKKTGLPKPYWFHLAVALKFHLVSDNHWCLSIRPEFHITKDGKAPYESEKIGSRVTKKKSRTYNYGLLSDIQFWRDFLSDGSPRIIFPFGGQRIVVETEMLEAAIQWPGMPEEYKKPFKNVNRGETLFSLLDFSNSEGTLEETDSVAQVWDLNEEDEETWE